MAVFLASPPKECDLCNHQFDGSGPIYDARMSGGHWANVCQGCFDEHDREVGVGRGQKYELRGHQWIKTAG